MQRGGDSWHLGNMQELLVRAYSCWQAAVCGEAQEGREWRVYCVVLYGCTLIFLRYGQHTSWAWAEATCAGVPHTFCGEDMGVAGPDGLGVWHGRGRA